MRTRVNPVDGAEIVLVPAGEFEMGLSEARVREFCARGRTDPSNLEMMRPQRTVYLDEFWIYRTPVTYGQFRQFCEADRKGQMPRNVVSLAATTDLEMDDSFPVVFVNWFQACAYCRWAKVALPTEAQWEKAARGTSGQFYPWGDEWRDGCANFDTRTPPSRLASPCRVDEYADGASPYGALQMSGNVKEWCNDRFAPYGHDRSPIKTVIDRWKFVHGEDVRDNADATIRNPDGPSVGGSRVVRGGGWGNANPKWAGLATYRGAETPKNGYRDTGFRPVG